MKRSKRSIFYTSNVLGLMDGHEICQCHPLSIGFARTTGQRRIATVKNFVNSGHGAMRGCQAVKADCECCGSRGVVVVVVVVVGVEMTGSSGSWNSILEAKLASLEAVSRHCPLLQSGPVCLIIQTNLTLFGRAM